MKRLLIVLVMALLATSCGGGGDDALVDAIAESIRSTAGEEGDTISDKTVTCMAKVLVDETGEDTLTELGITVDDVSAIDQLEPSAKTLDCLSDDELVTLMADGDDEESARCFVDELGREKIIDFMSTTDFSTVPDGFEAAADKCGLG